MGAIKRTFKIYKFNKNLYELKSCVIVPWLMIFSARDVSPGTTTSATIISSTGEESHDFTATLDKTLISLENAVMRQIPL